MTVLTGLFRGVEAGRRALDYHLERANVLAGNIANVETPGYRARELVAPPATATVGHSLELASPQLHHRGRTGGTDGGEPFRVALESVVTPGNDENAVSLEHELSKLGANQLRYDGAARIVQLRLAELRYAASDGNG